MKWMRDLLVGIVSSILATALVFGANALLRAPRSTVGLLDVSHTRERYGALTLDRVVASNATAHAFNPLTFKPLVDGKLVTGAVRFGQGSRLLSSQGPVWSGVLGAGESLQVLVITEGRGLSSDLTSQFQGTYAAIGRRGIIETQPVVVISHQQIVLARLIAVLWWVGGFVVVVGVSSLAVWWLRRRRVPASTARGAGPHPENQAPNPPA